MYNTILKSKQAELDALAALASDVADTVIPIIEITPPVFDYDSSRYKQTVIKHFGRIVTRIEKCWKDRFFFVDFPFNQPADGSTSLPLAEEFFALSSELNMGITTGMQRDPNYQQGVRALVLAGARLCIRLQFDEFLDPDINAKIEALLRLVGGVRQNTMLLLDAAAITESTEDEVKKSAHYLLRTLDRKSEWDSIVFCATSIPKDVSKLMKGTLTPIRRSEWFIWTKLQRSMPSSMRFEYGDYTICHPGIIDVNPKLLTIAAKIWYTADEAWLVGKGGVWHKDPGQYTRMCKALEKNAEFRGPAFSKGDQYIAECAVGTKGTGNLLTWLVVGISHHITQVCDQLSRYSSASTSP